MGISPSGNRCFLSITVLYPVKKFCCGVRLCVDPVSGAWRYIMATIIYLVVALVGIAFAAMSLVSLRQEQ